MLTDETIRKIFTQEKESQTLTRLPEDFFEEVRAYLDKKSKMVKLETDRWELDSIKRRLKTIFEMRERKILNASLSYVRSGVEPENMIPEEKKFFDKIVENIKQFQKDREGRFEEVEERLIPTVIIENTEKFVGINMRNYGPFKPGDIATLPEPNAKLLIERGSARQLEMKE